MRPTLPARRRATVLLLIALLAAGDTGLATAAGGDRAARCERLEARIGALRLKLRMGYTAKQGRLWREQLRGLEAERRANCR